MTLITTEQMATLSQAHEHALERELAADLRRKAYPHVRNLEDRALIRHIRAGFARARSHGFSSFSACSTFVVLMFGTHPEFDNSALVQRVLSSPANTDSDRINLLLGLVPKQTWEQIRSDSDDLDSAWRRVLDTFLAANRD